MAKTQPSKGASKVQNKVIYSRVSYLYQAATYLAMQEHKKLDQPESLSDSSKNEHSAIPMKDGMKHDISYQPLSRRLLSDLRSVSQKVLMRMSPAMKNSICRSCQILLVDGSTSTTHIENKSKGGKKPWADMLVRKCEKCGLEKRFPTAAERQPKKQNRSMSKTRVNKAQPQHIS